MNKFTKLILTSAVFATSGFASQHAIDGTYAIEAGSTTNIYNDVIVMNVGTMTIAKSADSENVATLNIGSGTVLTINGGILEYAETSNTYNPVINLEGILEVVNNGTLNLPGQEFSGYSGVLDFARMRTYDPDSYTNTTDLSNTIVFSKASIANVYLPYNCKFNNIDLSNVSGNIYYDIVSQMGDERIAISDSVIRKELGATTSYGDYRTYSNGLGVTLPSSYAKVIVNEIDKTGSTIEMNLSEIAANTTYNKADYKLYTSDLDNATHEIAEDTTYNFGFTGDKEISISSDTYKATFAGNNSEYAPINPITLPNTVEFAGDNSLFNLNYQYTKAIFSNNSTNTILSGKEVTFETLYVESGSILSVSGIVNL